MKYFALFLAVCGLLVSTLAYAQVPQTISYQGLLTTSSGTPIADGNYNLTFSLYTVPTGGTPVWTETQSSVPVSKGTFSVVLGSTTPFTGVDFAQQLYLGVTKDSDPEFSPRSALTSAPSAFVANAVKGNGNVVTSGVIDATGASSKVRFLYNTLGDLPSASTYHGMVAHVHSEGKLYYAHDPVWIPLSAEGHQHTILTSPDGTPDSALVVDNFGNVGIGTTAPQSRLDVVGNIQISNASIPMGLMTEVGGTTPLLNLSVNFREPNKNTTFRGGAFRISADPGSPLFQWLSRSAGSTAETTPMVLTETGNVGIGTTTPNEQLEITGNLRLPVSTASVGVIKSGGNRFIHNFGTDNFFAGVNAGNLTMTGFGGNTGVGVNALSSNTTGHSNTANGAAALYSNTTGGANTANGFQALYYNTTGGANTANGFQALYYNTTGERNTANGVNALAFNTTGSSNTANGMNALFSNTTGFNNTALGYSAGSNVTTGSNLTLIGYNAQPTSGSATNQITLGDANVTSLRCAVTTITALSDARDKKNIQELSLGLDFISKLKPRQFNWDKREWYENNISDGSKMQESPTAGFIAQELDEVQTSQHAEWLHLVLKDNPEKLEATPGNLLPIMVKAIQELGTENKELKKRLSELEAMVKSLVEKQSTENKSLGEVRMTNDQ
jgi:hypothetical protein